MGLTHLIFLPYLDVSVESKANSWFGHEIVDNEADNTLPVRRDVSGYEERQLWVMKDGSSVLWRTFRISSIPSSLSLRTAGNCYCWYM